MRNRRALLAACALSLLTLAACQTAPSTPIPADDPAAIAFHTLWLAHASPDAAPFWAHQFRAATDPALRHRCLFAYFTRVPLPATLDQVRTDLADPHWADAAAIGIVRGLGGRMPVQLQYGETVFCIVLPTPNRGAIYLRIPAALTPEQLRHNLASPPDPAAPPIPIDQIGVSPYDPAAFGQDTTRGPNYP